MATPVKRASLEELLVRRGLITRDQADALRQSKGADRSLRARLVEQGVVPEETLAEVLAEQYGLRYDPLTEFRLDQELFKRVPLDLMQRYVFLPLREQEGVLTIAVADPQDLRTLDQLELLLGRELSLVVAPRTAILDAAHELFAADGYHGVGLEKVAKQAGVSRQAVYLHFGSKGGLLLELARYEHERAGIAALADRTVWSAPGAVAALDAWVALFVAFAPDVLDFVELERYRDHAVDALPFGVQVYGYGQYTSYWYPGGLDLEEINPLI